MLKNSMKKHYNPNESGAIMIEGMIVMVITMFMLIWILGIGFVYYQRYLTITATNDAAVKIASTYNNPTSDIIMGYVVTEELGNRDLYRNFSSSSSKSDLKDTNQDRARSYILYILNKTNFSGVVDDVDVNLELIQDSIFRKHIRLTVTCTYNTPFGEVLEMFGMKGKSKYLVSSCTDCTDIADYISTVSYADVFGKGTYTKNTGLIDSIVKALNSFVSIYNRFHS